MGKGEQKCFTALVKLVNFNNECTTIEMSVII